MEPDSVCGEVWVRSVEPCIRAREEAHVGWKGVLEVVETLIKAEDQVVWGMRGRDGSEGVEYWRDAACEVCMNEQGSTGCGTYFC